MPTGKIKMFNEAKGYGFITPDEGDSDIFFHFTALQEDDDIKKGVAVSFEIGGDPKSGTTRAVTVNLV